MIDVLFAMNHFKKENKNPINPLNSANLITISLLSIIILDNDDNMEWGLDFTNFI
jgi:hypothetical protein